MGRPPSYWAFKCFLECRQFIEDATQGPHIRLLGIHLSLADLRGNVARSAHHLESNEGERGGEGWRAVRGEGDR